MPQFFYVGVAYEWSRSYAGGTARELCSPFGETSSLECKKLVTGGPAEKTSHTARLQLRKYISPQLAIDPRVNYDFESEVYGLELPIYFLQGSDGGLNGGLSLGWRSDEDRVTATFFVGAMKNLF